MIDGIHTTLAIESTCDDTSIAIVTNTHGKIFVHRMLTYSQLIHNDFGGAVPEFASRDHAKRLPILTNELGITVREGSVFVLVERSSEIDGIKEYHQDNSLQSTMSDDGYVCIESITVASHPGLPGSLVAGMSVASFLSEWYTLPLYEVNHIFGHVFSVAIEKDIQNLSLPYLCLTVSGGHSDMYLVTSQDEIPELPQKEDIRHKRGHMGVGTTKSVGPFALTKITQTMDDAIGEAYDKVSVLLGGPYPGGYWMDTMAAKGSYNDLIEKHIRPIQLKEQFSFSGVKAQVVQFLSYLQKNNIDLSDEIKSCIALRFQQITTQALISKLQEGVQTFSPKSIGITGGVAASRYVCEQGQNLARQEGVDFLKPIAMRYCVDNAAMIGTVGLIGGP